MSEGAVKKISVWPFLRGEEPDKHRGLELARDAYATRRNGSTIMQLGIVYLWLHRYQEAFDHFRAEIKAYPQAGDTFYGMAGAAQWCLGNRDLAVAEWKEGLDAKYAGASGLGVAMPLLLYFAAIVNQDRSQFLFAEKQLLEKSKDRRIGSWPAPIVKYVLGQADDEELKEYFGRPGNGNGEWLTAFYRAVKKFPQTSQTDFEAVMRGLSDTTQADCQDRDTFLSRMWSEEFFLARHEGNVDVAR